MPLLGMVQISTANGNRNGAGTLGTVYTAVGGGNGAIIQKVIIEQVGTTTAGVVRLYHDRTNTRMLAEVLVPAVTPSASVATWSVTVDFPDGLRMIPTDALKASTHKGETFNVFAIGAEL